MTSGSRRILVYGAGVLGSLYAARLWQAGRSVSFLARGQRLADLRMRGIVLEDRVTGEGTVVRTRWSIPFRPAMITTWCW